MQVAPRLTGASVTELLPYIDPRELPPRIQAILREVGPDLAPERFLVEIAEERGRQKDWASSRVAEVREALIEAAARHLDEMPPRVRARIEELRPSGLRVSPPRGGARS